MLKNILVAAAFLLLLTACEKQVSIDLPYEGNKLVLNSLMTKDSLIYARLTTSTEIQPNSSFTEPAGAAVELFENNISKGTMLSKTINGKKYFVSVIKSMQGNKYTLKATANGLDAAEGSDIIPAPVIFSASDFHEVNNNNSSKARLTVKINDPAGIKNYYRLRLYSADTNTNTTGPRYLINKSSYNYFKIDNISGSNSFDLFDDLTYSQVAFTDDTFDGREVTLTINIDYLFNNTQYIAPELTTLSLDTYRYLQSRGNQFENDGNPFVEPVTVYNNIQGGYGIVGGMADRITVVRKQ